MSDLVLTPTKLVCRLSRSLANLHAELERVSKRIRNLLNTRHIPAVGDSERDRLLELQASQEEVSFAYFVSNTLADSEEDFDSDDSDYSLPIKGRGERKKSVSQTGCPVHNRVALLPSRRSVRGQVSVPGPAQKKAESGDCIPPIRSHFLPSHEIAISWLNQSVRNIFSLRERYSPPPDPQSCRPRLAPSSGDCNSFSTDRRYSSIVAAHSIVSRRIDFVLEVVRDRGLLHDDFCLPFPPAARRNPRRCRDA